MKRTLTLLLVLLFTAAACGFSSDITVSMPELPSADTDAVEPPDLSFGFSSSSGYEMPEPPSFDIDAFEMPEMHLSADAVPDLSGYVPEEIEPFYMEFTSQLPEYELAELVELPEAKLAYYVEAQYDVVTDLKTAFPSIGMYVDYNPYTGVARLDSALLYAVDKYELTPAGKEILKHVMGAYASVLSREEFRDYISDIVIIGHTDDDGDYDYNQRLSERRANTAKDFCLSEESGIENLEWLASVLKAEGHSYDELIYRPDGRVDKAASRRVEIGFHLKIDKEE